MKIKILLISLIAISLKGIAQEKKAPAVGEVKQITTTPSANAAEITFTKELHDFGTISKGDNGTVEFSFKNSGKEPLIISNAQGSCGCTVPVWPKEPIAPGASSTIKVTYDTKRVGAFTKTVTITSNAKTASKTITIKGVVNDVPAEETFPVKKPSAGTPLEMK
jgi:ribosomal protein L19